MNEMSEDMATIMTNDNNETTTTGSTNAKQNGGTLGGRPATSTSLHYCNKSGAMEILGLSHTKFERLGLVPAEVVHDPYGYGGKEYRYRFDEIQALANNPSEVKRRLAKQWQRPP